MFFHNRWPVFYEDNHLLVLYKPAGLIMQRDYRNKANLLDLARLWIKENKGKPGNVYIGMVHRLDAPVAGAVILARDGLPAGHRRQRSISPGQYREAIPGGGGRPTPQGSRPPCDSHGPVRSV